MKNAIYKRYIAWGVTVFTVIALSIIFFFIIYRARGVGEALHSLINILRPFIYGAALAYVLNPVYKLCERLLTRPLALHIKKQKVVAYIVRVISTIITLIITFIVLFGLFYLVIPQLADSIIGIIKKMPDYSRNLWLWINQLFEGNPYDEPFGPLIMSAYQSLVDHVDQWRQTDLFPLLGNWAMRAYSGLRIAITAVINLLIGIIVMVYLLNAKHIFAAQGKKVLYSIFGPKLGNTIIENIRLTHRIFGGFINGKLLDSLIVGIICFIFLVVTKMPYAMLISVIIGVTNIIPFFGPFLGAIPSAILLLFESPILCLYFLIFILVLQQIDGNIIGPRILGGTTGLPSFWVLFAILLFGGMFGFVGMVLGVPLFALIYSLAKALIYRSLNKYGLPADTETYKELHHINTEDNSVVKNNSA
ncbi:MAG: AI-2E family transporter [Firmicutes bacterium]|nr:AI-2E family transporter [Bacillota bacterium]